MEAGQLGVWVTASSNVSGAVNASARLSRYDTLPSQVVVPAFLPLPLGSTFDSSTRTFSPGQPAWNALASAGASLGKVILTGTENRHSVYFAISGSQTALRVPVLSSGPGVDPAGETGVRLDVHGFDLGGAASGAELLTPAGPNLLSQAQYLNGFARYRP